MLCDVTKVHTGYLLMPRVTHCTHDENWGQPGGSRKVFMAKNLMFKGGEAALDTVHERIENKYWKIEVNNFTFSMGGFKSFIGEWTTNPITQDHIEIIYRYTLISDSIILYPFHWLFTKIYWRIYMNHVLENVQQLAYTNAPYLHK